MEREQRPLIWTDDDTIPVAGAELRRLKEGLQRVLLIQPDSRTGLQSEHFAAIGKSMEDPLAWK